MSRSLSSAQSAVLARLEQCDEAVGAIHAATAKALVSRNLIHAVSFGFAIYWRKGPGPDSVSPFLRQPVEGSGINRGSNPMWKNKDWPS